MKLETIFKTYGAVDYYDSKTGLTYALSTIDKHNEYDPRLRIAVCDSNGNLHGYADMDNPYYVDIDIDCCVPERISEYLGEIFSNANADDRNYLIGIKNKDICDITINGCRLHLSRASGYGINKLYVITDELRYKFVVTDNEWQSCWEFMKTA